MNEMISNPLEFDHDGFCYAVQDWDEGKAQQIAALDGIGHLNEPQLTLLRQLRAHYLRWGTPPALPHICRSSGFSPDCMNQLFPSAYEAWRVAGLSNPGDEAVAYL